MIAEPFSSLNWVDWGILTIVLVSTVAGLRRGFMLGVLDLVGIAASIAVALATQRPLAEMLVRVAGVRDDIATAVAFIAIVVVGQLVYAALVDFWLNLTSPFAGFMGPMAIVDRGLGLIPGLWKGLLGIGILLVPFAAIPALPQFSSAVEQSALGSRIVATAAETFPRLEPLAGRKMGELFSLMTPATGEAMRFAAASASELAPDPAAEEQLMELLNREREQAGLKRLTLDERLREVARAHSGEMFQLGYLAHLSASTGSPVDRLARAGIPFERAGENLAYAPTAAAAHEGLMASPSHRANILRPDFGRIGIGIMRSNVRGLVISQEFAD